MPGIAAPRSRQRNRPAIIRWTIDEQVRLEAEDDPLAEPIEAHHAETGQVVRARVDRADQERVADAQPLERLSEHARLEGVDVDGDVGELGHLSLLRSPQIPPAGLARSTPTCTSSPVKSRMRLSWAIRFSSKR